MENKIKLSLAKLRRSASLCAAASGVTLTVPSAFTAVVLTICRENLCVGEVNIKVDKV